MAQIALVESFNLSFNFNNGVHYKPKRWSVPDMGCKSRFTLNRKMDNVTVYWRCCKRSCSARITTLGDELTSICENSLEWSQCRCTSDSRRRCLCRLFLTTWLDGYFPLKTWNYHGQECPHTNNHLEGWHNRLKRVARKARPNICLNLSKFAKRAGCYRGAVVRRRKTSFKEKKGGAA